MEALKSQNLVSQNPKYLSQLWTEIGKNCQAITKETMDTLKGKYVYFYGDHDRYREHCCGSIICNSCWRLECVTDNIKELFHPHQEILLFLFYHLLKSTEPPNLFSYPFDTTIHYLCPHKHTSYIRDREEDRLTPTCIITRKCVVIYKAFCLDMAQGHIKGEPNETWTHSCRFASQAC